MTYKTRNIIAVIGFILGLVICYQLAISKTIDSKKEFVSLKQQESFIQNAPEQLALLNKKKQYYSSFLAKYRLEETSIQNNLLKTINSFTDSTNLIIIDFKEPHITKKEDLTINTFQIILEGDYKSIIKLVHSLEQDTKFGEIINLHFEKKTNFRTGNNYLQATMLLKNIN